MRILLAGLFAVLSAGLVVSTGPVFGADEPKSKADIKKELRKKLLEEAKKAATAEAAKPAQPAKPAEITPPAPAKPVTVKPLSNSTQFIDSEISKRLAADKITPAPLCSDNEFLRRAYLDLNGVIPTLEQSKQFLDSSDPNKRAKLIDELLANPNFGKHLADMWQARLFPRDSMNRFVTREPLTKWLEEQFNKNTPWDKFTAELVNGTGGVDKNPNVTFYLANRTVDKITDTIAQEFLGIQLQCAQCHNHPFTGWKQNEYWGMAAFFSKVNAQNPKNPNKGGDNTTLGVQEGNGPSRQKDFFPESTKKVAPKFLGGAEPKLNANEPYRPELAKWMTSAENPYFAKAIVNKTWGLLFGHGIVDPIDDMHDGNKPSHPELLNGLAANFAATGFDLKNLYRTICNSQAYQRSGKPVSGSDTDKSQELFAQMTIKVMTPEQLFDSLAQVTKFGNGKVAMDRKAAIAAGAKGGANTPRDQFVNFFLAGAETTNPAEYEAGIPQALRLMNSRIVGGTTPPAGMIPTGATTAQAIEIIYLTALSRRPTETELTKLTDYVSKSSKPAEGYADILWAVLNSSEFTMVR